jgi:hypothetical protein
VLAPRTLKILGALLAVFVLLGLPAYVGPSVLEPIGVYVVIVPVMSIYAFHAIGIPGLLEHQGHCGWGMCSPTAAGYVFLVAFWVAAFWLVAWGLAYLTRRR